MLKDLSAADLDAALDELLRAELVSRAGHAAEANYTFKHALVRDTAYSSLVKVQRGRRHGEVAAAIVEVEPELGVSKPELLAHHLQESGQLDEAFDAWLRAGDIAAQRQANREAVRHYQAALSLFEGLQPARRTSELELDLQLKLGDVLMNTEGYRADATRFCFDRARVLARSAGRIARYIDACFAGTPAMYAVGRFSAVIDTFEQITPEELSQGGSLSVAGARASIGIASLHLGQCSRSLVLLDEACQLVDQDELWQTRFVGGGLARVSMRSYLCRAHAFSGQLDLAQQTSREAVAIAKLSGHQPTIAWSLHIAAYDATLRGDLAETERHVQGLLEIAERLGITTRVGNGLLHLGQALIDAGQVDEGLVHVRKGYAIWSSAGGMFHCSEYAARAADGLFEQDISTAPPNGSRLANVLNRSARSAWPRPN